MNTLNGNSEMNGNEETNGDDATNGDGNIEEDDDVTLDRGGTNMIIGTNGIMIEAIDSRAVIIYNVRTRTMEIKSAMPDQPCTALKVEGKIYANKNEDISSIMKTLQERIDTLEEENKQMKNKLEEIYFAPGMPGYILAEEDWTEMLPQVEPPEK